MRYSGGRAFDVPERQWQGRMIVDELGWKVLDSIKRRLLTRQHVGAPDSGRRAQVLVLIRDLQAKQSAVW